MAKREIQEINAGSMADIAFLLLIFFLVATTMDVDTGLTRLLPAIPEDQEQVEVQVNKRNVLVVLINRDDQLMVGGEFGTRVDELKTITMEFFTNPKNDPTLPEMEPAEVQFPLGSSSLLPPDGMWRGKVSKGVISLQNDRSTTYKQYLAVQNELVAAVNTLRRDFCKLYFDKDYDKLNMASPLDKEISESIRKVYKMNISEAEPKNIGGLN
ncbi:MAG: biopolymer transporter ExbD [Bacteroidales bacterium]|jgi:biopolymer transport protein ExbD|nr:biopolymer transporter ExbD [Bacteroidales bacterium]